MANAVFTATDYDNKDHTIMKLRAKLAVVAAAIVSISLFSGCSKSASQTPAQEAAAKSRAINGWAATPQEQAKANAIAAAQQAAGKTQ